jgi:hypothetical protein
VAKWIFWIKWIIWLAGVLLDLLIQSEQDLLNRYFWINGLSGAVIKWSSAAWQVCKVHLDQADHLDC